MLVILALKRLRQETLEFKASPSYIVEPYLKRMNTESEQFLRFHFLRRDHFSGISTKKEKRMKTLSPESNTCCLKQALALALMPT